MKYLLLFCWSCILAPAAQAQINPMDSSVQAIVYWLKNDTARYHCVYEKIQVAGTDSVRQFRMEYDVAVTVLDSTQDGYVLAWHYSPVKNISNNPLLEKIAYKSYDITAKVKVDENGGFQELINWKQIQQYMEEQFNGIAKELPPDAQGVLEQFKALYASKSAVEESAIKDLIQLHYFYGLKYVMNEPIQVETKIPHLGSTEPLDGELTLILEEMDVDGETYTLSMEEAINQEQFTAATKNYLKQLSQNNGIQYSEAELSDLKVDMYKRIVTVFHESGWPLYSLFRQVVDSGNEQDLEIRTIEYQ